MTHTDRIILPLTRSERRVLTHMAQGLTYAQIGERMGLSERTTRWHGSRVLQKLGVKRAVQAAWYAWRTGIVDPAEAWATVENMQWRTIGKGR